MGKQSRRAEKEICSPNASGASGYEIVDKKSMAPFSALNESAFPIGNLPLDMKKSETERIFVLVDVLKSDVKNDEKKKGSSIFRIATAICVSRNQLPDTRR